MAASLSSLAGAAVSQSARIRCAEWCSDTKRTLRVVCRAGIDHQIGHDQTVKFAERVGQRQAGLIVADQSDEYAARSERRDVARDVAGAADLDLAARDHQHRRRRLRRNARDFAIDEIVEHQIADADHRLLRQKLQRLFEIEHPRSPIPAIALSDNDRCDRDNHSHSVLPLSRLAVVVTDATSHRLVNKSHRPIADYR